MHHCMIIAWFGQFSSGENSASFGLARTRARVKASRAAFLFQGYTQGHTFPRERAIRLPYLPAHRYFRGAGAKEVPLPPVP